MSEAGIRVPVTQGVPESMGLVDGDGLARPRQAGQSAPHLLLYLPNVDRDVVHASRLRLGMIEQVANQAPAPVEGEDRRGFMDELQTHQAVAMDEAGSLAACRGAGPGPLCR